MKTESLVNPKIILETQLYGWIWNLQSTQTTACSKIVNENLDHRTQNIIQEA
jgi:hypothetical protein